MAATVTFINALLEAAFKGETYTGGTIAMALFKAGLPSGAGVEVTGGSYARQTVSFGAAATKTIGSSSDVLFTNLPTTGEIVAWGIYDTGVLIDEGMFTTPFEPDITNNELETSYSFSLEA